MTTERRVLAVSVLGSAMAFLDATVVNVALPSIADDLAADVRGLQWVLDGYLVTLTALLLLGGSLGDRYGRRRVFLAGIAGFTAASVLCGLAPTTELLVAARALQGVGAALLVPESLALLSATVAYEERGRWIGAWSGLTGAASAVGPFVGGWLVDAASWRWVFFINVPIGALVAVLAPGVPESRDPQAPEHLDLRGAALATGGLAALAGGLIHAGEGWSVAAVGVATAGAALLVVFAVHERRVPEPMLPPRLFRSRQFAGANLVTLAVYTGLGGAFFLVVVNLQVALEYSALEAGLAMLPVTGLLVALSTPAGAFASRFGPRLPMTAGPLIVAAGLVLLGEIGPSDSYVSAILPAATVFGFGLAVTVAPLTAAVLAAVDDDHLGVGSATNNAAARLAGLLAVAVLPAVAGVALDAPEGSSLPGYRAAMRIAAGLCVVGAAVAFATIRQLHEEAPTELR